MTYCLNNPLRYIDPSGMGVLPGDWEWRQGHLPPRLNDMDGRGGSSGFYGAWMSVLKNGYNGTTAEFYQIYNNQINSPNFNGTIEYNVKTYNYGSITETIKDDNGYTLEVHLPNVNIINTTYQYTLNSYPQGGGVKPDGMVYSFSFDFAFGGGAGFEIGLVNDKNGGKQWFVSGNANIGYGISVGPSIRSIQSMPGTTFKASDYLGYSAGFSVGLFDVGGFYGGNKPQWNFTDFMDFGDSYIENGLGISKIKAPVFGAWWSNTSTKQLFGR